MGQDADGPWLVGTLSNFDLRYLLNAPMFCALCVLFFDEEERKLGGVGAKSYVGYLR